MTPEETDRLLHSYQRQRSLSEVDADYVVQDLETAVDRMQGALVKKGGPELLRGDRLQRISKAAALLRELISILEIQPAREAAE